MLRVVGGTGLKRTTQPRGVMRVGDQKATAAIAQSSQEDSARALIMAYSVNGVSVRDIIETAALSITPAGIHLPPATYALASIALHRVGIFLATGGAEMGMALGAYATVVDDKKLRKHIPELRKVKAPLAGLALF